MNEQDEALARRHEERERISHAGIKELKIERNETNNVRLTTFRFPGKDKLVQITVSGKFEEYSGKGFVVMSENDAVWLYQQLGDYIYDMGKNGT